MCFVCGQSNPAGLRQRFERRGGQVVTTFVGHEQHQGWPGVVHGGIVSSLLDETLGRAAALTGRWTMTARLEVRFRRPLKLHEPAEVSAEMVNQGGRAISARGEVRTETGTLIAEAEALMVRVPPDVMSAAGAAFEAAPLE
jgi:uncharacterized protein (TIGR00369 family)